MPTPASTTSTTPADWLILSHSFNQDGQASSQTITDKLPYLMQRGIRITAYSGVMAAQDTRFTHQRILPWGAVGLGFDVRQMARQQWGRDWRYRITSLVMGLVLLPFVVLERLVFGLQGHVSWTLPVVFRALLYLRKHPNAIVYATGGAYSAHLAGYWIKKLTGATWISEVHDPMVLPSMRNTRNTRMMAKVEGYICRHADLAWWFTDEALNSARKRHPELGERGIMVLPGVERLTSQAQYQRGEHMVMAYFGLLARTRSMLPMVLAVKDYLQRSPAARSTLRIHVYGGAMDADAAEAIAQHGLDDVFIGFGRLERSPTTGKSGREQVIDLMYQADCLLLLHGSGADCREYIPSKMYEYLWANRPIFALTHNNAQLDAMLTTRQHYVAPTEQHAQIVDLLARAHSDWQNHRLPQPSLSALGVNQAVQTICAAMVERGLIKE